MKIVLSLSGDGCADYSDNLANLWEQVFKEKSLYSCSFYPTWAGSVLHSYRSGHATIELQVRGRAFGGDPCDFSAIYQIHIGTFEMLILRSQPRPGSGNVELVGPLQNNLDQPVLVGVIEVAQDGKERRHDGMRSVVRLDTLDGLSLPAKIGETLSPSEITVQGGEVQGP